jgi:branched-chain amino acid transport system permease protein
LEILKNIFDFSGSPRYGLFAAGMAGLVFFLFPILPHSSFSMSTIIQFFMFSLYAMGWNTIGGFGGQVDLGQAQFLGIGAYTTAVMTIRWNTPFWVCLPVGMSLAVVWSFVIGYPLFRLRGHYFAITSIAASLVLKDIFDSWSFVGASRGLEIPATRYSSPDFLHLIFTQDTYYYYIIFAFFLFGFFFINWFRRSRLAFQLRAINSNEEVARSLGINAQWTKIKTYAIATAFVSAVGCFHACYIKNIETEDTMGLDISILIALTAMLGGMGSLWGPIIGAGILIPLKSYIKEWLGARAGLVGLDLVIYAAIIMLISAFEPRGIWGIVEKVRRRKPA